MMMIRLAAGNGLLAIAGCETFQHVAANEPAAVEGLATGAGALAGALPPPWNLLAALVPGVLAFLINPEDDQT